MAFSLIHKKDLLTTEGIIPQVKDEITVGWAAQIAANTISLASEYHPGIVYFFMGTLSVPSGDTGTLYFTKRGNEDGLPIFENPPVISIGIINNADNSIYYPTPFGTCDPTHYYQAYLMPPSLFFIRNSGLPSANFLVSAIGW